MASLHTVATLTSQERASPNQKVTRVFLFQRLQDVLPRLRLERVVGVEFRQRPVIELAAEVDERLEKRMTTFADFRELSVNRHREVGGPKF